MLPAFIEELLFRGVLMGALEGAPFGLVLTLQALAFGAFHVDVAQSIATFILGLGFGFMRYKTRSLAAPMVSHATYNLVVLVSMRYVHEASHSPPNQGWGLVAFGLFVSMVCMAALTRYARDRPRPELESQ